MRDKTIFGCLVQKEEYFQFYRTLEKSPESRAQCEIETTVALLNICEMLKDISRKFKTLMMEHAVLVQLKAADLLWDYDDTEVTDAFLVVRGCLTKKQGRQWTMIEVGTFTGRFEYKSFDEEVTPSSCRAVGHVEVLKIPVEVFEQFSKDLDALSKIQIFLKKKLKTKIFADCTNLATLIREFDTRELEKGERIEDVLNGKALNQKCYFVFSGAIQVYKKIGLPQNCEHVCLGRYRTGESFGYSFGRRSENGHIWLAAMRSIVINVNHSWLKKLLTWDMVQKLAETINSLNMDQRKLEVETSRHALWKCYRTNLTQSVVDSSSIERNRRLATRHCWSSSSRLRPYPGAPRHATATVLADIVQDASCRLGLQVFDIYDVAFDALEVDLSFGNDIHQQYNSTRATINEELNMKKKIKRMRRKSKSAFGLKRHKMKRPNTFGGATGERKIKTFMHNPLFATPVRDVLDFFDRETRYLKRTHTVTGTLLLERQNFSRSSRRSKLSEFAANRYTSTSMNERTSVPKQ